MGLRLLVPLAALPLVLAGLAHDGGARARRGGDAQPALDSLIAAERAFARLSATHGMRAAFLGYLAPDGVIFRPRPVVGRPVWEARGPIAAKLLWEPSYAEVSAAGDLGWTTGPWELRPDDAKGGTSYGHFVSVWRTQPDGAWRVAADIGIGHARPAHGLGDVELERGPAHAAPRAAAKEPNLLALDEAWTAEARARGAVAAFARVAARDVRLYREGAVPVLGAAAAGEVLRTVPGTVAWSPVAQLAAVSADLGCTYGYLERGAAAGAVPDSSVYLHVWRREGARWKVALALETPLSRR